MGTMILRLFIILICSMGGLFIAGELFGTRLALLWGAAGGFVVAILSILIEESVKKVSLRGLCGAVIGLIAGFIVAKLLVDAFLIDMNEGSHPAYGNTKGISNPKREADFPGQPDMESEIPGIYDQNQHRFHFFHR